MNIETRFRREMAQLGWDEMDKEAVKSPVFLTDRFSSSQSRFFRDPEG